MDKSIKIKKQSMHKAWPYLLAAPYVLCYVAFTLYPTFYSFFLSFFDWNGIKAMNFVGLANYRDLLFKDKLFWKAIWNTIQFMLLSVPIQTILGLVLANAVFSLKRTKRAFETVFFLPYIIAPIAIGSIFSNLFDWQYGYINEFLISIGLIDEGIYFLQNPTMTRMIIVMLQVWRHFGYCMVIYMAGMTAISPDIYEAARIDGANEWQLFSRITVPQLNNLTIFLIMTSIINGMQLYEIPKQLYAGTTTATGGPGYSAYTIIWKFINDAFANKMRLGYGAALCYILFVIILVFSFVSRRISNRKGADA
ncbi:MAG: sugar ABC transporter permease [Clostridia bacterium]|nr:sugar ABC transporter permease [Clostridia bacterium]